MKKHYLSMIKDADERIARSLDIQYLSDERSPFYGGFRDANSLIEAKFAIYRVTTMIVGYINDQSRWYRNDIVYERILLGFSFIMRTQRENGFFDLNNCNFYSGPDTAFCLKRLIPVFCYLRNNMADDEQAATLIGIMDRIIKKGADAMCNGGFHTPNHRWAIASVLCFCSKIYENPIYREAADKYLAEGNDCNSDGEYAERSAGNYNRINNDAMIMLALATGDEGYFDPVIRNLRMMLTYIEPDGSVFTNNSTRQDRGHKSYPKDYYFEYLYIGHRFNIKEFLDAANYIMETVEKQGLTHMDSVISFMNNPGLIDFEHGESGIPSVYSCFYRDSNIVRARNNNYSYSVINKCPSFLYFQSGQLTMGMKIGASFCEHRYFIPETIEEIQSENGKTYHLRQKMVGWYYLPFDKPQNTTDWWKMDHTSRKKLLGPDMIFDITVTPAENGLKIRLKTEGIDRAPLRVELSFDAGSRIDSDSFSIEGIPGGGMVAKSGDITVSKDFDSIKVGPAFGAHNFTAGKFGSDSRNAQCFTVYLTDHTCFDRELCITAGHSLY